MEFTFLGTGAATSYPLIFCHCKYCDYAREFGGKDLRKRCSVLINDDLLIDLGPDIMSASFVHRKDVSRIKHCLQTHPHSDHFDASHLSTRIPEYAGQGILPLELYASQATLGRMAEMLRTEGYASAPFSGTEQQRIRVTTIPVEHMQTFVAGNYEITAFAGNHDDKVSPLLYAIQEDDRSVFYGTDTDDLPQETWAGFHNKNLKFNVVILDHTYGPGIDSGSHLSAEKFIKHIERFKEEGLLANGARAFATHISHEGNPPHEELQKYASTNGYEIAYDGLTLTI
jgi:phosphoribosyl 1,2-cyclic phosphate phosphodiesterase